MVDSMVRMKDELKLMEMMMVVMIWWGCRIMPVWVDLMVMLTVMSSGEMMVLPMEMEIQMVY